MSIKALVETITEMPDGDMVKELITEISDQDKLVFSDSNKLFRMVLVLLQHKLQPMVLDGFRVVIILSKRLLPIYLEGGWTVVGAKVIELLGNEDGEVRKKAQECVLLLVSLTQNSSIYLESIYRGFDNASNLRTMKLLQVFPSLLSLHPSILKNQKSIPIVKALVEKVIGLSIHKISNIERESRSCLGRLFHIKEDSLDEIVMRLDGQASEQLHRVWEKELEGMQHQTPLSHQFCAESLPLINNKIFGVLDKTLISRVLEAEKIQERRDAIEELSVQYECHFQKLIKFSFHLNKLILRVIPAQEECLLGMLLRLYKLPDIRNRIVVEETIEVLVGELGGEKVSWRKAVRECLVKMHYIKLPSFLQFYEKTLKQDQHIQSWFRRYEILLICEGLIPTLPSTSPPLLDNLIITLSSIVGGKVVKLKKGALSVLSVILFSDDHYRDMMYEILETKMMEQIEDHMEKLREGESNEFLETRNSGEKEYEKEYEKERTKYKEFFNSHK